MRLTIERDGKTETVDVAPDLASATLGGKTFPIKVVKVTATKVELEIAGERIDVDAWPDHFPTPPGPVDVGGERWNVTIRATSGAGPGRPTPTPSVRAAPAPTPPGATGPGVPVFPPMPGKVLDVRVKEGDEVRAGAVLLRLEAMKMVNEITSPIDGRVRDVRARAGENVRAREPLLYVVKNA
jgi:glutaconyl-CoA/methylmalonyl-CoA decarboxylase subunit gamma